MGENGEGAGGGREGLQTAMQDDPWEGERGGTQEKGLTMSVLREFGQGSLGP